MKFKTRRQYFIYKFAVGLIGGFVGGLIGFGILFM